MGFGHAVGETVRGAALSWSRRRRERKDPRNRRLRKRDALDCVPSGDCCPCDLGLVAVVTTVAGAWRATSADPHTAAPPSLPARVAWRLVRSYQLNVSARRPAVCPLTPSCSRYALLALSRHGGIRGGRLVVGRLFRCGTGVTGTDAVPA